MAGEAEQVPAVVDEFVDIRAREQGGRTFLRADEIDRQHQQQAGAGRDWNAIWYGSWFAGASTPNGANILSFQRTAERAMNVPRNAGDQPQRQGFHSLHPSGAQFVFGDGAVRFVSENTEHTATTFANFSNGARLGIYQRLFCRDCGLDKSIP